MHYDKTKHDIGIVDGTLGTVGLMLYRKNGVIDYTIEDVSYLAPQFFATTPAYNALPPEQEFTIVLEDWRAGFGKEFYDSNDSHRYLSSIGADLRHENMGIAGPLPGTATFGTAVTVEPGLTNPDMEGTSGWTLGTAGAYSTATYWRGTSSMQVSATGTNIIYQNPAWQTEWQGKTVFFNAMAKTDGGIAGTVSVKVGLSDGSGTSYSSACATDTAWHYLKVSKTLSSTGTSLRAQLWVSGSGTVNYFDDAAIAIEGTGSGGGFIDFNDNLYAYRGNCLGKLNAGGTGYDILGVFATNITDAEVFSDNKLYLAMGWAAPYFEMTTAEAIDGNILSNNTMKYFASYFGTTSVMAGADSTATIRTTTNPARGGTAWSGTTSIDKVNFEITDMVVDDNVLYILKEDRPFYLDSTGNVQVLAERTKHLTTTGQGKNSLAADHRVYYPCGAQSLLEYNVDDDALTYRDPSLSCSNLSEFVGAVQATAADDRYIYIAVDNGTAIEILAGRLEVIDNTVGWAWHPISEITLTGAESMYVSSVNKKRLWIASTSLSDSIYYVPLTTKYGDITNDSNYSFKDGTYFITPGLHAGFPADLKAFTEVELTMEDITSNIYWECHYKKLGDTDWTDIGDFQTAPTTRKYLPDDASGNHPVSTHLFLKPVAKTNDTTKTPQLKKITLRGMLYPKQGKKRRITSCTIRCADNIRDNQGNELGLTAAQIRTTLHNANEATWPVTIYDAWGTDKTVKFLPLQEPVTNSEKDRELEQLFYVKMQEVTLS